MSETPRGALSGLRVVDFCWGAAGPIMTKHLADHGAEVIRIESMYKPDWLRALHPNKDGVPGFDRSGYYANFNSSKRLISLNLNDPRGVAVFKRLVQVADAVTENFTPKAMRKWGVSYDDLAAVNPSVVMLSLALQGQTGPHAFYLGYGNALQALAGINHLTGWPDREPVGTGVAYTDFTGPYFAAVALLAALDYRRRTGEGQYIDLSQLEAGIHLLETAVLDFTANGNVQERMGNGHPEMAPHGTYRCRGEERWLSLACEDEAQWRAVCTLLGHEDWLADARFASLAERIANREALDALIDAVTRDWDEYVLVQRLQGVGVPTGVVQNSRDLHQDPQLAHRSHYWRLAHGEMGVTAYDSNAFKLSRTPPSPRAAPTWAEANEYVYRDLLAMGDDEYVDLLAEGVLE